MRRMEIIGRSLIYFKNKKKTLAFLRLAKSQFVESLNWLSKEFTQTHAPTEPQLEYLCYATESLLRSIKILP
ncbi:hypothetical protein EL23_00610 [Paenibacillus polymyxa]|nr:hypothetical protein EL23_00610 [Paenibacillus polymyxa]